ncbi:MAG: ISKra4-like element ISHoc2 family transposase, partial [Gemmatimonadales bacterium]
MSAAVAEVERDAYAAADACYGGMVGFLKSGESRHLTESQLERTVEERIRELARRLIQAHVEERAPGPAASEVRGSDGVARGRERVHERGVQTIFGEVRASRVGYGADGVDSLHPLDAELNLPEELYSLEVRRRAAEAAATQSFDETVASLERLTGSVVGKRQVEELVQRAALDFDAFYARRSANPQQQEGTGSILVISADGKGVVMLPRDLREATRKAAEKASHKLEKRLSKGEKRDRKRMATVATVYTVAPHERRPEDVIRSMAPHDESQPLPRPRPENKRVWASLEKSPAEVIEEAFREASCRDPDRKKAWVALVDGNKTQ